MYLTAIALPIALGAMALVVLAALSRARANAKTPAIRPQERRLYKWYLPLGGTMSLFVPSWAPRPGLYIALTVISVVLLGLFVCIKRHEQELDHYEAGDELLILFLLCTMLMWGVHGLFPEHDPVADTLLLIMVIPATMSALGVGWVIVGLYLRRTSRRAHSRQ